jgi:2-polyprenyl-3-methyl-5-hydroxy-6-metoxy-1,4-benzoquinol methylase
MNFEERDIRPEKLIKKAEFFFNLDAKNLYSKKSLFVQVNCPACNCKKKTFFFKKNFFSYYICSNCKTYFMNPRPNVKTLNNFYQNSKLYEFWNNYIFPATEKIRRKKIFEPRAKKIIEICKKLKVGRKKLIDIGSGFGSFCIAIKNSNFFNNVVALEPSESGAKKSAEKNIKTLNTSIERANKNDLKNTSVFTLFEVIEHMYSPYNFLNKVKKFTNKNTLVVFTCPNGMGFDISFLGKKSQSIDHEHLNYFNPTSIHCLAKRTGFRVVEVLTPGVLDVDILKNKYELKKLKFQNNFFLQVFADSKKIKNLQNFLIKNKLSSNMWVILVKN